MGAGGMYGPAPRIPRPANPTIDESPVTLSFKYLDLESNPKFDRERCSIEFLTALLEELCNICQGKVSDLAEFENRRHNHLIDFGGTTEEHGFSRLPEQIEPEVCWQFAVREHHQWRVHGFFIESVFYIVWLDPEHQLCAMN
jgi:hypothetical protein